jgi:glycosyltransferase involved in cell wall biosynthesis
VIAVSTPIQRWEAFVGFFLVLFMTVAAAKIPFTLLFKRALIEIPFIFFALLMPFFGTGERFEVGPLTLKLKVPKGRGAAIREGLLMASGDVAVTFPADNEYSVDAILDVARSLANKEMGIVFGSRSTLCVDTDARLIEIYGGRTREYFLSKWGGMMLSIISAIRFRRRISDPLTSIKGFKGIKQMKLSFEGNSLDWDTRVISDSWVIGIPIMEIPVQYAPRTRHQGKKTTVDAALNSKKLIHFCNCHK